MTKAVVVGYGSIGARHVRILQELGHDVAVVSRREVGVSDVSQRYADIEEALREHDPAYVVIANRTAEHRATLQSLNEKQFSGDILIEKPLFEAPCAGDSTPGRTFVAYNLRFHPILQRLRALLQGERILSAQIYVGQYLPQWRPQSDYRASYSAHADQGGGVLRDLSHELDYVAWLFDGWNAVSALGGHFSSLEIDSDDVFSMLLTTPSCPVVNLQMNYLDRIGKRVIIINTDSHTIEADLVKGVITMDDQSETIICGRDDTYRAMHQALLDQNHETLCTFEEGMATLTLIAAIERAAANRQWVMR